MKLTFIRMRWVAGAVLVWLAAGVCAAQQGFPLRPGEWEAKSEAMGQSLSTLFCFTNETWSKALTQDPICKVQKLSASSKGIHYLLDCDGKSFQMKGPVDMTFDGMEHMTGKASLTMTMGGKTSMTQTVTEYRWKAAACSSADVNMKAKPTH